MPKATKNSAGLIHITAAMTPVAKEMSTISNNNKKIKILNINALHLGLIAVVLCFLLTSNYTAEAQKKSTSKSKTTTSSSKQSTPSKTGNVSNPPKLEGTEWKWANPEDDSQNITIEFLEKPYEVDGMVVTGNVRIVNRAEDDDWISKRIPHGGPDEIPNKPCLPTVNHYLGGSNICVRVHQYYASNGLFELTLWIVPNRRNQACKDVPDIRVASIYGAIKGDQLTLMNIEYYKFDKVGNCGGYDAIFRSGKADFPNIFFKRIK